MTELICIVALAADAPPLKPGTQLKQTKVSLELPLKPIKADFTRPLTCLSRCVDAEATGTEELAKKREEEEEEGGQVPLPSDFSNTEQCR